MTERGVRVACATAALALACAGSQRRPELEPGEAEHRPAPGTAETGVASFYSPSLEGRRTASGDRYRAGRLTCAHRSYPFGTALRVTDLDTGRSVVVQVNDRGPFTAGRVVDLSWAAAKALGILERGLARVRVEVARHSGGRVP